MHTREDIAATYALVHRFLKQQSKHKAAAAVKEAAKPIVVLRDDMEQEGPPLEDIIKAWKTRADTSFGDTDLSSEVAESDSEAPSHRIRIGTRSRVVHVPTRLSPEESENASGSTSKGDNTSESDDGSGDSDGGAIPKKPPSKPIERDTSVTLSSENTQEVANQATNIPRKSTEDVQKAPKNENKNTQSDSADSSELDTSSQTSDSDGSDTESSPGDSSSSGSSDSSDKCGKDAGVQPPKNETKTTAAKRQSTSESSSDETDLESEQSEDTHIAKRRKISPTSAVTRSAWALQKKERPPPKVKERFQRVKIQNIALESLLNNGYEARGGRVNDYGERAHRDLVTTRGAGFRKEKNKKKRGSYRGGEITMENHSIRFDF